MTEKTPSPYNLILEKDRCPLGFTTQYGAFVHAFKFKSRHKQVRNKIR